MGKNSCSSGCSHNCSSCDDIIEGACPICGNVGMEVPYDTVSSLIKPEFNEDIKRFENQFFNLCTHKACNVAYYNNDQFVIDLKQITVPIWFKHNKEEYIICYCRRINLEDIKEAVTNKLNTKEEILIYLNKSDVMTDCLHNNPTGLCCDRLFDNAIEYFKKKTNE